jgi:uncharacterized protein YeeX (DUF496 family)
MEDRADDFFFLNADLTGAKRREFSGMIHNH